MKYRLFATTTMGLESVLAKELRQLHYENIKVFDGKVEFDGDLTDICRCNLWLRTAGRVYLKVTQFKAVTFDALYDQTTAIDWKRWIQVHDCFPITKISSRKSTLFSKSDSQAIIKKAIVDALKSQHNVQHLPESSGSIFAIRVQIENDIVTLSIDTTGPGLNKRGYRAHMDKAPLRETLAAGLLLLSRWRPHKDTLYDPFCGTGTILIEAAMIAQNRAPGLYREFAAEKWKLIPKKCWKTARETAISQIKLNVDVDIHGTDINQNALDIAVKNSGLAKIECITFKQRAFKDISAITGLGKIITNPPYGERLNNTAEIESLYCEMGSQFKTHFLDWTYYILSSHDNFEQFFGFKARKNRKLYNGGIQCRFYQYFDY